MSHIEITDINYLIKGEIENLINLNIKTPNGEIKNKTFLTDTGNQDAETSLSASSFTHRIIKTKTTNNSYISKVGPDDVIYALFDFKDVAAKSKVFKKNNITSDIKAGNGEIPDDAFIDIYAPHLSSDPVEFCNGIYLGSDGSTDLVAFGLSKLTTKSPLIKGTNLLDTRTDRINNVNNSLYWNYKVIESDNKTYLAVPLSNLEKHHFPDDPLSLYYPVSSYYDYIISYGNLSVEYLSNLFVPIDNLKDVERNYIYQLNLMDNRQIYNNHNTGNIMCDFVIGKNPYDAQYSMNMNSVDALSNARNYVGLGSVGGRVFFKYYDNINYSKNNLVIDNKNDLSTNTINKLNNISLIKNDISDDVNNNYQKIEYLNSVSQFKSTSTHKSNLYSIKVRGLFDNISPDSYVGENLEKIKSDITRSIRKIAEDLSPAHTQLFDVIYYGKSNNLIDEDKTSMIDNEIFEFLPGSDKQIIIGLTDYGKIVENLPIPGNVKEITNGALNNSKRAVIIEVNNNPNFSMIESMISSNFGNSEALVYNNDTLVSYPVDGPGYYFVIPESISNVYSSAFYNCNNLYKVDIPLSASIDGEQYYNEVSGINSIPNLAISKTETPIIVKPYYSYTVTFKSGVESISDTYSQHFYSNINSQLSPVKFNHIGYLFDSWEDSFSNKYKDQEWNYVKQFAPHYGNVDLIAKWRGITYYIYFDPHLNGITIKKADGEPYKQEFTYGTPKKLLPCRFTLTGYSFKKWNRYDIDGISIGSYDDEQLISNLTTVNNDIITLNPSFDPNTYYISFKNLSTNISTTLPPDIACTYDKKFTLSTDIAVIYGNLLSNQSSIHHNYVVSAWKGKSSNGHYIYQELPTNLSGTNTSSVIFNDFENLEDEPFKTVNLTAQWAGLYYINFNNNSSEISSTVSGDMPDQQMLINPDKNKRERITKNKFVANNYRFDRWKFNTKTNNIAYINDEAIIGKNTLSVDINPGDTIMLSADWIRIYYIKFDLNGGSLNPDLSSNPNALSMTFEAYIKYQNNNIYTLPNNICSRTGYEFKGWSIGEYDNNDSSVTPEEIDYYYDGKQPMLFSLTEDEILELINRGYLNNDGILNLYAVWEPNTYYVKFNENL